MKPENAIEAHNISKSFKVFLDKGYTLKEKVLFRNRRRYEVRKVLDNISFDVNKGEALGLIGENGCGKSTTLKLLTRIMYPDSGTIEMRGRVSSLIELGAGFHPDMSGRQNIYTNASIFGLTKKEIDARLDDIIDFSELREFIDNPVRTYSSGMYMRLAFAVAINVDADILLIDEILAVGDTNFQAKCFNHMRELKAKGVTIVLVTHDTSTVERFCNKAIWIEAGKIAAYGKSSATVDAYISFMNQKRIDSMIQEEEKDAAKSNIEKPVKDNLTTPVVTSAEVLTDDSIPSENKNELNLNKENLDSAKAENGPEIDYKANHFGLGNVKIRDADITDHSGRKCTVLEAGNDYTVNIHYQVFKPLEKYVFGIGIFSLDGFCIMGNNTQIDKIEILHTKMEGIIKCRLPELELLKGTYALNVAVVDQDGTPLDFYRDYCHFEVISACKSVGLVNLKHEWIID